MGVQAGKGGSAGPTARPSAGPVPQVGTAREGQHPLPTDAEDEPLAPWPGPSWDRHCQALLEDCGLPGSGDHNSLWLLNQQEFMARHNCLNSHCHG